MKPKTWTHPKFAHLQRALGIGPAYAAGILQALWHLAATFSEQSGTIVNSSEQLEAWMQTGLDPTVLVEKLVETKWLDRAEDGTISVHGWVEHRPSYVNDRLRMRNVREQSRTVSNNRKESPPSPSDSPSPSDCSSEKSTSPHKKTPPKSPKGDPVNGNGYVGGELMDLWNRRVEELRDPRLKPIRTLTKERQAHILARMTDPVWRVSFIEALQHLPFHNSNSFTFQPTFDWLIRNATNALKVAEGNYDERKPAQRVLTLLTVTDGSDKC